MFTKFTRRAAAALASATLLAVFQVAPAALAAGLTNPTAAIDAADVTAIRTVTLTLPAAANLADGAGVVKVVVRTMAGTAFDISGAKQITAAADAQPAAMALTNAGDANGVILLTDVGDAAAGDPTTLTLTFPANTFTADTAYQFSFFTDLDGDGNYTDGDFGSAVMIIGTSNDVVVTAQVEPTLTMNLANTAVDLGILTPSAITASATDPTATIATNALNGWTLQVVDGDGNVGLNSATAAYTIAATANNATAAGADGLDLEVSETADPQTNGAITAAWAAAGGATLTGANQTVASGTGPTNGYTATVNVRAAISNITPAATDYTTNLTFSVTGGF
jgi:hypothetical protein